MRPLFFLVAVLLACVLPASGQIPVVPDIATIPRTDGNFVVGDGTKFVGESGATARASMGLGSIATQNASAIAITGGAIDGAAIGNTTPASGKFTTLQLASTTSDSAGIVFKNSTRFLHDFHHPTGGTAVPDGLNVFLGNNAGNFTMGSTATSTSHGSYNVGIGYPALERCTTGYSNMGLGSESLRFNTTGYQNAAVGRHSLYGNTAGNNNLGVGMSALKYNTTGSNNAAIGFSALGNITTGSNNIGVGYLAGHLTAAGANNTSGKSIYIGGDTKAAADGDENEIVIGYSAVGAGSNSIVLGNSATTVMKSDAKLDITKGIEFRPGASETPTNNGDVVFELTSNTVLTVKVKGSDGTVRKATLTLAP